MDAGLLLARLIVGFGLSAHGAQKLFGWFGGHGLKGTGGFFESLGFRPGVLFALAAGLGELGGGLLIAAGFLGPLGPALITVVMLVAILTVHRANGFFASVNGIEMPFMYLTAAPPVGLHGRRCVFRRRPARFRCAPGAHGRMDRARGADRCGADQRRAAPAVGARTHRGMNDATAAETGLAAVPPDGVKPGTVVREVGRGWRLQDGLLRPPQVVVATAEEPARPWR